MKIDRRRLSHWAYLLLFFLQSVLALAMRMFRRAGPAPTVVLYGHKLNGNLLALHKAMADAGGSALTPVFLTMDPDYKQELEASGVRCVWACGPCAAKLLATASAVISDHGLHSMQPLLRAFQWSGLRFFDVWHGIPFKGFDAKDFRLQHCYDETWVASELCRDLYVHRFGFPPERVVVTGYARTDRLVSPTADRAGLRALLGLPVDGPLLLFAPTWKQDAAGRSLYPFGCSESEFLGALAEFAEGHGATVVLRSHLNSGDVAGGGHSNVQVLPASCFPDAESILLACDLLICDWSSIAFDFLLLDRPTVFLDVAPPFRKGFSLGPDYRFGPVVNDLAMLLATLGTALADPEAYWRIHGALHRDVRHRVYGGMDDGGASKRCLQRLHAALSGEIRTGSSR